MGSSSIMCLIFSAMRDSKSKSHSILTTIIASMQHVIWNIISGQKLLISKPMQEASAPLLEMLSWPDNPIQGRIIPSCDAGYSPLSLSLFIYVNSINMLLYSQYTIFYHIYKNVSLHCISTENRDL